MAALSNIIAMMFGEACWLWVFIPDSHLCHRCHQRHRYRLRCYNNLQSDLSDFGRYKINCEGDRKGRNDIPTMKWHQLEIEHELLR